MKKYEVLSPVGDVKSFYAAINAGADAVYMGLPKFNARMNRFKKIQA
jgi:putative protease